MLKGKKPYFVVAFGVVLYVLLTHVSVIYHFVKHALGLALPIVVGFILAFVLNVPMTMLEKLFDKNKVFREKLKRSTKHKICLFITLVVIGVIIYFIIRLLVPQVKSSFMSLYDMLKVKVPEFLAMLRSYGLDTTIIEKVTSSFDLNALTNAGSAVSFIFGFASSVFSIFVTIFVAIVISVYCLFEKDSLKLNFKKFLYAMFSERVAHNISYVGRLIKETYFNFFSGQVIESVILGLLMLTTLSLFQIPYAGLIALLTAVSAFIPYVGAFLSCGVGCLLLLVIDPAKAILCLIVYECTQLFENQIIYPHVVGNSVGLSALWTLVAVVIGGSMFGVVGMIFFIPLMAVCVELISKYTDKKLREKNLVVTVNGQEHVTEDNNEVDTLAETIVETMKKDEPVIHVKDADNVVPVTNNVTNDNKNYTVKRKRDKRRR